MIQIRPARTIYHAEGGWFSANWHFSIDHYYDPNNMGWGLLRVLNDDRLVPGAAWPMHPHRDIEGITYVAEGMFEHADSRGNGGVLPPGSVQRATLGSGMMHSEKNHSQTEPMRFIQMWIIPSRRGLEPSVEERTFSEGERRNRLRPVVVPAPGFAGPNTPVADAVTVHQDAAVYASLLDAGATVGHRFRPAFLGYFFVAHGSATLSEALSDQGGLVDEGGAARIAEVPEITLTGGPGGAEVLLVDVPPQ